MKSEIKPQRSFQTAAVVSAVLIVPAVLFEPLLPLVVALGPLATNKPCMIALFSTPLSLGVTALAAHLCSRRQPHLAQYLSLLPLAPVTWAYGTLIWVPRPFKLQLEKLLGKAVGSQVRRSDNFTWPRPIAPGFASAPVPN
jgi:hypothetical protein